MYTLEDDTIKTIDLENSDIQSQFTMTTMNTKRTNIQINQQMGKLDELEEEEEEVEEDNQQKNGKETENELSETYIYKEEEISSRGMSDTGQTDE